MQAELMALEAQSVEMERDEIKHRTTSQEVHGLMIDEQARNDDMSKEMLKQQHDFDELLA